MPRSCWAVGSAMVTMVVSSTIISWASAIAANPHHLRACSRSGSTAETFSVLLPVLVSMESPREVVHGCSRIHYLPTGKVMSR